MIVSLTGPATKLLSVRFHFVNKSLGGLIILISFEISRGFWLPGNSKVFIRPRYYVHVQFTTVNLSSGLVCRQFIWAFPKQFLKPFGLDLAEAFSRLPSSELRCDSQLLVVQVFFFLFIFFDGQSRLFSFSDSNTYLGTEISIISLALVAGLVG